MRKTTFGILILASLGAGIAPAFAADSVTTRIEPRPYYGAVVTVEHGVRVYRPLPNPTLTIINPNQTPVNLSFSRSVEYKAAEGSGGHGGGGDDNGGGARYGGISGIGNDIAGTGIQRNRNAKAHGVGGMGTAKARHHVRRYAKK